MSDYSYSDGADQPGDQQPGDQQPGDQQVRELATIPAIEVISRAAVMLMSAAAEKIGPEAGGDEEYRDLAEARPLINALAGLVTAASGDLGLHRKPILDGVKALQAAFREASAFPDEPGQGPGENILGPAKG